MVSTFKLRDYVKVAGRCCLVFAIVAVPVGVFAAVFTVIYTALRLLLGGLFCT